MGNPDIQKRRLLEQKLIEKQVELQKVKEKFTPDHPVPTKLLSEVEGLKRLFSADVELIKEEPSKNLKLIETEVQKTKKELESLRKEFQEKHPEIQNRLDELNALQKLAEETLKEQKSSKADKVK